MDAKTLKQILNHIPDDYEMKVITEKGKVRNISDSFEVHLVEEELHLKVY